MSTVKIYKWRAADLAVLQKIVTHLLSPCI
jgi:hypothetical protein